MKQLFSNDLGVSSWHDAIRTLAKFHRVDPKSVGLERFGKPSGFYDRQVATFTTIQDRQAEAVDVETKVPVGHLPHFKDMVSFFSNKSTQPPDMGTLVHGDYKIDNIVFHKTEPRVIGILDWEMATVGHPLSDLCNLTSPYYVTSAPGMTGSKFQPGSTPGLPVREDCTRWYTEVSGWDPTPSLAWGDAFYCFRSSLIMQGIAARYALRQASSAKAQEYGSQTKPFALATWDRVQKLQNGSQGKARL